MKTFIAKLNAVQLSAIQAGRILAPLIKEGIITRSVSRFSKKHETLTTSSKAVSRMTHEHYVSTASIAGVAMVGEWKPVAMKAIDAACKTQDLLAAFRALYRCIRAVCSAV
jgi:hemoglobin-like flavoprotein